MEMSLKHDFIINTEIVFQGHFLYQASVASVKILGLTMQRKKHQSKTLDSEKYFSGNLR